MREVKKSVEINAPLERVWEFLTQPKNLPGIWPSMVEVRNVQRRADGWNAFDWTYKMAGLRFHGHAAPVEIRKNERMVMHNESGIPSTFRWTFEGRGATTVVTCEATYSLPTPVVGRIAEAVLVRFNEHELEAVLVNAKATLETTLEERAPNEMLAQN